MKLRDKMAMETVSEGPGRWGCLALLAIVALAVGLSWLVVYR